MFYSCMKYYTSTNVLELFDITDSKLYVSMKANPLERSKCLGTWVDGSWYMSGCHKGLQAIFRRQRNHAVWSLCMMYRTALASKNLRPALQKMLGKSTNIANHIKTRLAIRRMFESFVL